MCPVPVQSCNSSALEVGTGFWGAVPEGWEWERSQERRAELREELGTHSEPGNHLEAAQSAQVRRAHLHLLPFQDISLLLLTTSLNSLLPFVCTQRRSKEKEENTRFLNQFLIQILLS